MRMAITGDVMLGRLVDEFVVRDPDASAAYVWGDCLPLLQTADLRLINLECVVAGSGRPWRPLAKMFHFRANPGAIEWLRAAKIDFVSLANNHSMDYGTKALAECLELLDRAGIAHAGAGRGEAESRRRAVLARNGKKLAIVSLTDNEPAWEAKGSDYGTFYVDYDSGGLREPYRSYVERTMNEARSAADIVIVCAHVGPNWGPPSPAMRVLAHELVEMGADCYWGHSNHTPQGVEVCRGKPILYSTGDFIDDYAVDARERNDLSFLFMLDWRDADWKLTLTPTKIENFQANRVYGEEASFVMRRMQESSRAFGATVRREGDVLTISAE